MYCSLSSCSIKDALHQLFQHWRSISKTRINTPSFVVFPCWHWASENHNRICIVLSCTVQSGSKISLLLSRTTIVKTGALWCFRMWWGFFKVSGNYVIKVSFACRHVLPGSSHHGGGNVYIALYRMKIAVYYCVAWYCIICHIKSVETGLVAALTFIQ